MRIIKTNTSRVLLKEFSEEIKTNTIWTRSYFVSTAGDVSAAMIRRYVRSPKDSRCNLPYGQKNQNGYLYSDVAAYHKFAR